MKLAAATLWRVCSRNVLRQRLRTAIAVSATASGVVALVIAGGFVGWILSEMRELSIRTWYGHVQVARSGYWELGSADPKDFLVRARPDLIDRLARDPRIEAIAPRLKFAALASHRDTTLSFIGEGVDPAQEARFGRALIFVDGRGENLNSDADEAVIGQGLAANLGVAPGDTVVLLANPHGGGVNAVEVRIRGVFLTASKAFDDSTLRVPLPVAQKLLRADGVHSWTVLLKDSSDTDAVLAEFAEHDSRAELQARPWTSLAETFLRTEALFARQLSAMSVVLGLLIVAGISNTMTMSVIERTSEIGTAMALGASRARIVTQFIVEGALLGIIGGAAGVVVGVSIAWLLSWIGIPLPPPPGLDTPIVAAIRVDLPLIAQAFLIAASSAVLASVYPALRASRLVIVDALRHARL